MELQFIDYGPQYSSDSSGDGPNSDGELDVQTCANNVQECPAPETSEDPVSNLHAPASDPDSLGNLVDIPEFDPNNNFAVMPNWMRYDPKLHGPKRYSCIVCKCEVPPSET